MPVILPPEAWPLWLGEVQASPEELLALLRACPAETIRLYRVGDAVGNVRNDGAGLLEPLRRLPPTPRDKGLVGAEGVLRKRRAR